MLLLSNLLVSNKPASCAVVAVVGVAGSAGCIYVKAPSMIDAQKPSAYCHAVSAGCQAAMCVWNMVQGIYGVNAAASRFQIC